MRLQRNLNNGVCHMIGIDARLWIVCRLPERIATRLGSAVREQVVQTFWEHNVARSNATQ